MATEAPFHAVVAGGGPAGVEAILALQALAGDRVRTTLVAPDDDLELKPYRVATPFATDHARSYPLAQLTRDAGAEHVRDALAEVRPQERTAVLRSGAELHYDALLVAVGARAREPFARALTFGTAAHDQRLNELLADVEGGYSRSIAFVVPPGVTWPLPLYELALMTAGEVWSMGVDDAQLTVVTPEPTPLAIFGPIAGSAVAALLDEAGVDFRGSVRASVEAGGELRLHPGDDVLRPQRIVTIPELDGPAVRGLPADEQGFLPIDEHARVRGADGVFAAGDGADFPVKQGGLGCQQADAAAYAIAAAAGAPVEPEPFRPVLRGKLLTGHGAEFLRAALAGGGGDGEASGVELWWPPAKLSGRWLSRHLAWLDAGRPEGERPKGEPPADPGDAAVSVPGEPEPEGTVTIDVPLQR
jgi:sulfide:quinone oxidoreductase